MASKASKKRVLGGDAEEPPRNRGGRPKRQDVVRFPCGDVNENATRELRRRREDVIGLRMRNHGLRKGQAESEKAGSVFGRLYLQGELGKIGTDDGHAEIAFEAGQEFERRRVAYAAALSLPRRPRSGSDLGYLRERLEGREDEVTTTETRAPVTQEEYEDRVQRSKLRYGEVRRVALEADPLGLMALETIVVEDKIADSLVGPLRLACNAIARMMRGKQRA